ncbi:MAG: bacteriocin [Bacteroidales bacterium]
MKTRNPKTASVKSQFEVLSNNEMNSVLGGAPVLIMRREIDENGNVVVVIGPVN